MAGLCAAYSSAKDVVMYWKFCKELHTMQLWQTPIADLMQNLCRTIQNYAEPMQNYAEPMQNYAELLQN